ncbi:MAG: hypothetical protein WDN75_08960 [Bacteroidota bacterium]
MKKTLELDVDSIAIALLREELKSRKLAILLAQLGVSDCQLLPSLNEPIAECLGLDTDEAFLEYDRIMNECAEKVGSESGVISNGARSMLQKMNKA